MTEEHVQREQLQRLSALVDGELQDAATLPLIDRLERDPELRQAWERYHLISMALRRDGVCHACRAIGDRVRERVAAEPTVLVPAAVRSQRPSRIAPFAGAALAAGAAFLAVFAVPALFEPGPPAVRPTAISSVVAPAPFQLVDSGPRWQVSEPRLESKLDRFLVNHQATAPTAGLKGFLPYATVVGYETGR